MPTQTHAGWIELRDALGEEPGELAFRAVASILDTWPGDDTKEALSFADMRLSSWPDESRVAPWSWCCAAARGESPPSLALARTWRTWSDHLGCEVVSLWDFADRSFLRSVSRLEIGARHEVPSIGPLHENPSRWPALRYLDARATAWTDDDASFLALGQSPLIRQLEFLRVNLEGRRADVRKRFVLRADRLVRLNLSTGINDNLVRLIETSHLPCLRELALTQGSLDPSSIEAARRLAQLPAVARLTRLESWVCFPEEVLVPLFETLTSGLEALVIMGNPYIDYAPELISSDAWLSPSAMRVIAESASLKSVRELRVENERVGDVVVAVVAACTPGRLGRLELVDVGLTDDGADALARLPQLAGVTHLDLRANQLGPKGIGAICRSPYLAGLTTLAIGGRSYNPYYDDKHVQAIGDDGLAAIVGARAFANVRELEVANAGVSPAGVAVLAGSPLAGRLRRLDLSTNELGIKGAEALAVAHWPVLRELRLRRCALDDAAIEALARTDFRSLRDLDLSYNSVGPSGASALATSARLEQLWRLNLHDNFIGDTGLIALARSPALTRLVELNLEQDCWNARQARFSDQAARAVANSSALRRLDSLFGGQVDEYHCSREEHPCTTLGLAMIDASSSLRPAMRCGLRLAEAFETEVEDVEETSQMTKEKAREAIHSLQDAIAETLGDAGKPAVNILSALLAGKDKDPAITPIVETPRAPAPADDLRRRTNDFRFRAKKGKDERPATE